MDLIYSMVVALHLFGMAALVGGYLVVAGTGGDRSGGPGPVMLWGARVQLLTGLVIVGLGEAVLDYDYDHAKVGVKLAVSLVVVAVAEVAAARARRRGSAAPGLVHAAGALAALNVLVAVLWG
jgi:hypothetical protein